MIASTQILIGLAGFNQVIIVLADIFGTKNNFSNVCELIKDLAGVSIDVANDMSIAATVYCLIKGPGSDPCFQFWNTDQGRKGHAGRTALY